MLDRIKALMAARQLSPSQFADQTTLPRPVVSHILSGRNKPSLEVAQKIMSAFPEVSVDWLLNGRGEMVVAPTATALPDEQPPAAPTERPAVADADAPPRAKAAPRAKPVRPAAMPTPVAPSPPPADQWAAPPTAAAAPPPPAPQAPPPVAEPLPAIAAALAGMAPTALAAPAAPALTRPERVVRRILVFYSDGSFSDHRPLPPEENPFL